MDINDTTDDNETPVTCLPDTHHNSTLVIHADDRSTLQTALADHDADTETPSLHNDSKTLVRVDTLDTSNTCANCGTQATPTTAIKYARTPTQADGDLTLRTFTATYCTDCAETLTAELK